MSVGPRGVPNRSRRRLPAASTTGRRKDEIENAQHSVEFGADNLRIYKPDELNIVPMKAKPKAEKSDKKAA